MGLISHAAAAGLGYALARPEGRRQLLKLRDQARGLLQHPQIERLQERGREVAGQQAAAAVGTVKEKLGRSETPDPAGPKHSLDADDPRQDMPNGVTGFTGTTVGEEPKAPVLGVPPLPDGPPAPVVPPLPDLPPTRPEDTRS